MFYLGWLECCFSCRQFAELQRHTVLIWISNYFHHHHDNNHHHHHHYHLHYWLCHLRHHNHHPRHTFTIIWFEWICILWLASSCWLSIFSLWQLIPYSAHLNSWKSPKHDIHTSKCVWLLSQTDQEDLHFILPGFWGLGQILIWKKHIIFVKNFRSKKTHKILDWTDKCFWWWNGSQPRVISAVGMTTAVCCK